MPSRAEALLEGLTEEKVLSRVHRVQRRYYEGDIHGVVEIPPCSKVMDSGIPFFQFHLVTARPDPNAPLNRILGWAHPALKELLLYNGTSLFINRPERIISVLIIRLREEHIHTRVLCVVHVEDGVNVRRYPQHDLSRYGQEDDTFRDCA
jgi:hypothetical protein